jgi:hypothetical protein
VGRRTWEDFLAARLELGERQPIRPGMAASD